MAEADLVIGAVLVAGAKAPKVVTAQMISAMRKGSVIVDIAIDQGGCIENIRETTHKSPTYDVAGVIHYAVGNVPGAVPFTSTYALTNATLPYIADVASYGVRGAIDHDPALLHGINVVGGKLTHPAVAEAMAQPYAPPLDAL